MRSPTLRHARVVRRNLLLTAASLMVATPAIALVLPEWIPAPKHCHLEGKAEFVAWAWAVQHADRAAMYELCDTQEPPQ